MAGKRVELRLTQTNEIGDLINSINNIHINGGADILTAVKVAQLSLKHRQNKSQRQRIVVFVGHPIEKGTEEDFEDVGLRLKKNNVSIDIINFANPDNVIRLEALVNAANKEGEEPKTCHFLDVPQGVTHITDIMITSPILQPEDNGAGGEQLIGGGADAGAGAAAGLGFDPNMDPELAMALRLSMEEHKAAEDAANNPPQVPAADAGANAEPASSQPGVQPGLSRVAEEDDGLYDEDNNEEGDDDEKALAEALALSMLPDAAEKEKAPEQKKPEAAEAPKDGDIDTDFMKNVIGDLGINIDENELDGIMDEAKKDAEKKDEDKDKDKEK